MQSSKGIRYSAFLHIVLLALMLFGLPSFLQRRPDPEPVSITVEILPISEKSNVKPQEKPVEKVEEKKPEAEQKTTPKAQPAAKQEVAKPKEEPIPVPTKEAKPVVVKKEEKPKKEKPKPKEDDLDAVLNSVKSQAKTEESKKPTEQKAEPSKHAAQSTNYDASLPLSMSETDNIRQQVARHWNVLVGSKEANVIELHIEMTQDGSVTDVKLVGDSSRYASDPAFRAAADMAMRAVHEASPFQNLPVDKYGTWSSIDFTFDPKEMQGY